MSKIDELIAEFCPEGVRFETLDKVSRVSVGTRPTDQDLVQGGPAPYFNGGVRSNGSVPVPNTSGDTVVIPSRGSVGVVGYSPLDFWCGPLSYRLFSKDASIMETRYLYFFLKSIQREVISLQQSGSIPALNKAQLIKIRVPVPPLEVQREIVSILDKFTQLEAELEAELEARKSQLEAIRDQTLYEQNLTWPEVTLGQVAELVTQRARADASRVYVGVEDLAKDKRGLVCSDLEATENEGRAFEVTDVLLGNIRPYLRKVWQADRSGITNGDVVVLRPRGQQEIGAEFLLQIISSERFFQHFIAYSKGAKMPRGDKESLLKFSFRLPPLSMQLEVCKPLKSLSTLTMSQIEGIPAEISARRKQYEHYRNKLLTFKELEAA
jgi:type I restriction enzyme S subunit